MILDREEIKKRIPHRSPMLLIEKVIDLEEGKRGVGIKAVSPEDSFFEGHFPGNPIMPGVLIIECMAQVAAVVFSRKKEEGEEEKPKYFGKINNVIFRRPVVPGDVMYIEVDLVKRLGHMIKVKSQVKVRDVVVVSGELILWDED